MFDLFSGSLSEVSQGSQPPIAYVYRSFQEEEWDAKGYGMCVV